ncbi:hypothetical protein O9929_23805 [Vibrio lentus]|nr:hypothetical protein [Vibrio lentus]
MILGLTYVHARYRCTDRSWYIANGSRTSLCLPQDLSALLGSHHNSTMAAVDGVDYDK